MKKFMAIYTGSNTSAQHKAWERMDEAQRAARQKAGMEGWMAWGQTHKDAIVDQGAPLGKTKRVTTDGIADFRNSMAAYTIVQAESHEAAAKMFESHPHFTLFPGDGVEIMEYLPIPTR